MRTISSSQTHRVRVAFYIITYPSPYLLRISKMLSKVFIATAALATLAKAIVIPTAPAIAAGYGLYTTYVVPEHNISLEVHAQGFKGTPSVVTLDLSNWHEVYSPIQPARLNRTGLQERDICGYFADCSQQWYDTTTTAAIAIANTGANWCQTAYTATLNYWSANNYANVNSVVQGAIIGLAVNIASTPIGAAILGTESGTSQTSGNDQCNVQSDKARTANYFASSVYDFCMAIQSAQTANTNTDFLYGEFDDSNGDTAHGDIAITRNFVAAQAGNWGPTCSGLGISWRRVLARSLGALSL
jgi:hypothetical protein